MRLAFALVLLVGCASSSSGHGDAGTIDAEPPPVDAMPADAETDGPPPVAPPRPGSEIVSSGARLRTGTITMDAEIGFPVDQSETSAGTRRLRGAAVVNP